MLKSNMRGGDPEIRMVASPDHPMLLSPPDLLVAKRGKIIAYYSVKASEINNPKHLLSRLSLGRYALPTHSQHILVAAQDNDPSLINRLSIHFEDVVNTAEISQSFLMLNSSDLNKTAVDRAYFGRDRHYIKYNLMYELSLLQLSSLGENTRRVEVDSQNYEKASYSRWREFGLIKSDSLFESKYFKKMNRGYFAIPEFERSSRRLELLKKICLSSIQLGTTIENGVIVEDYEDVKLILADEIPGYRHDELKGIRAAAFAGLGLSHARNDESLDKYSEFISYRLERGLNEYYSKKNRYNKSNSRRK